MSEQTITSITVAVVGLLGSVVAVIGAYYMAKLKQQGEVAARMAEIAVQQVAKVATTLEDSTKKAGESSKQSEVKLEKLAVVADATHKLVNSNMGIQLQLVATALRRIANLTRDKKDEVIASEAEERFYDHQSKQQAVDSKHPGGVPDASD